MFKPAQNNKSGACRHGAPPAPDGTVADRFVDDSLAAYPARTKTFLGWSSTTSPMMPDVIRYDSLGLRPLSH